MGTSENLYLANREESAISVTLIPSVVRAKWVEAGNTADFIADFYNQCFNDRKIRDMISTVLNELIENAVKFSGSDSLPVNVESNATDSSIVFRVTNSIKAESLDSLYTAFNDLESSDLGKTFTSRIENLDMSANGAGIGLILLKKFYKVRIGLVVYESVDELIKVTVSAEIPLH